MKFKNYLLDEKAGSWTLWGWTYDPISKGKAWRILSYHNDEQEARSKGKGAKSTIGKRVETTVLKTGKAPPKTGPKDAQ